MRFKVAPPVPESLETLREACAAVPRVPKHEDDCCARVVSAGVTGARDEAKEWLTFCRALDLVAESDRGYHATESIDSVHLAERFLDGVYGAEEVIDTVRAAEERGARPADVYDTVRGRVPAWEAQRHEDVDTVWREQVDRLLGWGVLIDLLEVEGDRYVVR